MRTKIYSLILMVLFTLSAATVAWSADVELQSDGNGGYFVNMPAGDDDVLTIPDGVTSFKVYDDGGKNGAYTKDSYGSLQMTAPAGYALQVSGTISACVAGDQLVVFDGTSSGTRLLDGFSSSASGVLTSIGSFASSSETMTIYFESSTNYCSASYEGLNLTVNVLPSYQVAVAGVLGGSLVAGESSARAGQTVALTATPDEGYVLDGVVAYSNGTAINVHHQKWNNTASFVMPAGAVTLTPVFKPLGEFSLNMPISGTDSVFVPATIPLLKVYDDGGDAANYSNNARGYLRLVAPDGYVFRVTGSVMTEKTGTDFLTIFDGEVVAFDDFVSYLQPSRLSRRSIWNNDNNAFIEALRRGLRRHRHSRSSRPSIPAGCRRF